MKKEVLLQDLIEEAAKEYIDDVDDAGEIIDEFYNLTLDTFQVKRTKAAAKIEEIMIAEGLKPEKMEEMTFLDFLEMLDDYTIRQGGTIDEQAAVLGKKMELTDWFRRNVERNFQNDETVARFNKVTLSAYMLHHARKMEKISPLGANKIEILLYKIGRFYNGRKNMDEGENRTMADVIRILGRVDCDDFWLPWHSLENYAMEIEQRYELLDEMMINPLRLSYRDEFCREKLMEKYTH